MWRLVLVALLISIDISCVGQSQIIGLWSYVDRKSNYWEEVYTDSLFWVYSDELGIVMRKYKLLGDSCVAQTYLDGTYYSNYIITEVSRERISYVLDGQKGLLKRIRASYDFNAIIQGDSIKLASYVSDYRRRKYQWESKHKKR